MLNEKQYINRINKQNLKGYNIFVPLDVQNFSNFDKDKEKIATDFAEGSQNLKQLLLLMWSKNIKTNACCAGHEDKDANMPYIHFFAEENFNFEFFAEILKNLKQKFGKNVYLSYNNEELADTYPKISFHLGKEGLYWWDKNLDKKALTEEFFKTIYDGFASEKNLYSSSNFEEDLIKQLKKSSPKIVVLKYVPKRLRFLTDGYSVWLNLRIASKYFPDNVEEFNKLLNDEYSNLFI